MGGAGFASALGIVSFDGDSRDTRSTGIASATRPERFCRVVPNAFVHDNHDLQTKATLRRDVARWWLPDETQRTGNR